MALELMDKIDVSKIIRDHVKTWSDDSTGKYHLPDFLLFLGCPAIVTVALLYIYGILRPSLVAIVATSLSVFAALLFNLLLLVYDAKIKAGQADTLRSEFLRQVSTNVSFSIFVAVISSYSYSS